MALKKLPGIVQILGLLGCVILPLVLVLGLASSYNQRALILLYIPFLLMPALACRLLFEGDESKLGKFFFGIGDMFYGVLFKRMGDWMLDNARNTNRWNRVLKRQDENTLDKNDKFIDKMEEGFNRDKKSESV